jgi:LAGLIDADG DNA endonuclease family protein
MCSDNPSGAVNQQERPNPATWLDEVPNDLGHFIAGFVDGEGSFNVPIRRSVDRGLPFRVSLSFNVSQVGAEAPRLLQSVFGAGTVRGRGDGVWYFEMTKPEELVVRAFPFFDRFPLRFAKTIDLAIFRQITAMVQAGRHLSVDGFIEVLALRAPMNRGGKRRRTDEELIEALRCWESSEAIRKAPLSKREEEDMVHAP